MRSSAERGEPVKAALASRNCPHALDMNPTWPLYEVTWAPIPPDVLYYPAGYRRTKKVKRNN